MRAHILLVLAVLSCSNPAARAGARAVSIHAGSSSLATGSGFLLDSQTILTCAHVLPDQLSKEAEWFAQTSSGNVRILEVSSPSHFDLRIYKLERSLDASPFPPDLWKPREEVKAGESVMTIASPFGLSMSTLYGHVSHTNRTGLDPQFAGVPFLQVQGIGFPGTSGAAVYAEDGRVIGILRASYGGTSGIGLVIPSGYVVAFLEKVR